MELGPHSVVYIAFGTHFFPLPQSIPHLMIIIDEILAQGFRLVFALSSHSAKAGGLCADYIRRMTKAGSAIFPEWATQLEVLEHPVSTVAYMYVTPVAELRRLFTILYHTVGGTRLWRRLLVVYQ
jgi:hypothetical protein